MTGLRVGDLVCCLDSDGSSRLTAGCFYFVVGVRGDFVSVSNDTGHTVARCGSTFGLVRRFGWVGGLFWSGVCGATWPRLGAPSGAMDDHGGQRAPAIMFWQDG